MTPDLTVSRTIAAPPAAVFAAISDITRMGEWSNETFNAEWNEGSSGPAIGARFTGHNRHGEKEWSTIAEIVDLVENERFFFDCESRNFVFAKWGYSIEESDGGSIVTEYWQDLRPESAKAISLSISGVEDRVEHNRRGMEETLARIAAAVEATA